MAGILEGKTALVTGAARGIGALTARRLASDGATVVVADIIEEQGEATAADLRGEGAKALFLRLDVTDEASWDQAVARTLEEYASLDILVNNAGITRDGLIMRMKQADWDLVLKVNLTGTFLGIKAVSRPMMKQRSGVIVNVASVVGLMGNAGQANYVASKAGVVGLTKTAARELGSRGVRVMAVAPGYIRTEMTEQLPEEVKAAYLKQVALGRAGTPQDVAEVIAFLVSPRADYLTGQTIQVDGGLYM
jgi:3-oxoacyl-[acyl-carrier protein] reductase